MDPTDIERVQEAASWKDQSQISGRLLSRNKALCIEQQAGQLAAGIRVTSTQIPSVPLDTRYRIYFLLRAALAHNRQRRCMMLKQRCSRAL